MGLFKYIQREAKEEKDIHLPAENGPLFQVLPPIVIKEANQAVAETIKHQGKRNPYLCSVEGTKEQSTLCIMVTYSCRAILQ